jgi:hypothetical protein
VPASPTQQRVWTCGFYPGCDPGQQTSRTGETFKEARAGFEKAWQKSAGTRTEAHYELWLLIGPLIAVCCQATLLNSPTAQLRVPKTFQVDDVMESPKLAE